MRTILTKIITAFLLTSLMAMALLSFAAMVHEPNDRMKGDCPFSAMGASLCPQDALAELAHHVAVYRTFFNVPSGTGFATLITLLFALATLLVIFIASPPLRQPVFVRIDHGAPPRDSSSRKITDWLSLFENSPSHA